MPKSENLENLISVPFLQCFKCQKCATCNPFHENELLNKFDRKAIFPHLTEKGMKINKFSTFLELFVNVSPYFCPDFQSLGKIAYSCSAVKIFTVVPINSHNSLFHHGWRNFYTTKPLKARHIPDTKSLKSQDNPDNLDFSRHSLKSRHLYKHPNPLLMTQVYKNHILFNISCGIEKKC